jgi:preprotein translocase subunit YajC
MFSNYLLQAGAEGSEAAGGAVLMIAQLLPLVLVFVVFYFMLIRPQKKRDKEIQKMRSNLEVGDEVVTSGGIIGRVVSLKEDTLVIETGSDRSKLRIARWAVQTNNTVHDDTAE